jgi:hypothetical protein
MSNKIIVTSPLVVKMDCQVKITFLHAPAIKQMQMMKKGKVRVGQR